MRDRRNNPHLRRCFGSLGWFRLSRIVRLDRIVAPVSSQVLNCSLMAAEGRSDRRTLHRIPSVVTFRRDALEGWPPSSGFRAKAPHAIRRGPATSLRQEQNALIRRVFAEGDHRVRYKTTYRQGT
ncbi:MAG: hypothetical protein QOI94_530 [Acidobacteriaceae bacterium]|jgi:hypothetical protein|nr:hypothetical protein [Acidobacteriaceae bacterium]